MTGQYYIRIFRLSKIELLVMTITVIFLTCLMAYYLDKGIKMGLADPKPKLPPLEDNRVYHPAGFSIIAPKGWRAIVETTQKEGRDRIWIQPKIDARWVPKLIVDLYHKDNEPYYAQDPNDYHPAKYLEYDAVIYEGLWFDYHGWHAVFSHQDKCYGVLLNLPHGHGPMRYNKVPDYWWAFLNTFQIDSNTSNSKP